MIKKFVKDAFFGKDKLQPFFRRMFDISMEGMNIGTGGRSMREDGELFALEYVLKDASNPIVFDVGAQGGEYSSEVLRVSKGNVKVYAFEPSTKDNEILHELLGDKITISKIALGGTDGEAILYSPDDTHGLSSLYQHTEKATVSEKVQVETIDTFCRTNNILHITLLKLDVEGGELACLHGAKGMLPNIDYIQFEFSGRSRDARVYFKDIFDFLGEYTIYRILKNGLFEIQNPEKITELLFTTNYLAVQKNVQK